MSFDQGLARYEGELSQCVRCGACQAQCPVYLETGHEGSVARGKIVLAASVLDGSISLDEGLKKEAGLCLLCGSCVRVCPNQVPTDSIVAALRRRITAEQGLSPIGKGVATLLGSKTLLRGLLKGADWLAPLLFKKIPQMSGLQLRFSPEALKERTLPPLPDHHLFDRVPEFLEGQPGHPVLGVFAGCMLTYLYPDAGEALVRVLHSLGFSVVLPRGQGCCGMPALSSGNGALLDTLAAANRTAFAGRPLTAIVTACASCHGMLAHHYADNSQALGPRLVDIHVLLEELGVIERLAARPKHPERIRVTYHDPCHLSNAGITRQPRDLLRALPQVDYVEMEDAGLCCGLGGTFSANYPELSRAIGDRKRAGLLASRASVVASDCPGCLLQLHDIIARAKLPLRTLHTLDLLRQALDDEPL